MSVHWSSQPIAISASSSAEDGDDCSGFIRLRFRGTRRQGLKAFDAIFLYLFVDERFDGGQLLALLGSDEGDGDAVGAHAAGAADAVHVILRIVGQVVVDDVRDVS